MADASLVGKQIKGASFPVERGKVREFVRALGENDPIYSDPEAAAVAGFDGLPVPPTFTATMTHWLGADMGFGELDLDLRRVLHGEARWEYLEPIYAGDELRAVRTVTDVNSREGRRGGTMTMLTLTTELFNQDDVLVVRVADVIIERAA